MKINSYDTLTDQNKITASDVAHSYLEAYINQRDWEKARQYLVDIVEWFDIIAGGVSYSTNGHKQLRETMYRLHPNTRIVIGDLRDTGICDGVQVVSGTALYINKITEDKTTLRIFIICIADRNSGWKIRQLDLALQGQLAQSFRAQLENDPADSRPIQKKKIFIRTFGYFDVFVDGHAIPFRSAKAKELLAVLVDRRGGFASRGDIIGCLWEDEPVTNRTMTRCRKAYMNLLVELAAYGADGIVESNSKTGERHVIPDRFECDLFQYLSEDPQYKDLFHGAYMGNYSWSEYTLGILERKYSKEQG